VFPPFTVDTVNRTLLRDGRAVPLGSRAFDTLVTLIRHRDRVVEKEDFLREAWRGAIVEESNLTKQISLLRKVLEDTPSSHRYIVTVPGTGYRFGAQVDEREVTDEPDPKVAGSLSQWWRLPGIRYAVLATVGAIVLGAIVGKMTLSTARPGAKTAPSLLWQFTFDKGVQTDPTWSPDGLKIAYSSDRSGYEDIWLEPVDGGMAVPLTQSPAPDVKPDWSPDGKRLVFATLGVGGGIRLMSSTGEAIQELAPFGNSPKWSPDGSSILFTRSDWGPAQLYISTLDGAPPRPVLEEFLGRFTTLRFAWHPDSRRVSVWGVRQDTGLGFWTVALDGTGVVQSATAPGVLAQLESSALSFRDVDGTPTAFSWSPRGDALVFEGVSRGVHNLWRVGVDPRTLAWTQGPERLTTSSDRHARPQLSQDGRRLAFVSRRERVRLWSFPFDPRAGLLLGSGEPLTSEAFDALSPDVSPDGSRLVYTAQQGDVGAVRVRDMQTGADTVLVKGDQRGRSVLRWAADSREVFYARDVPPRHELVSADLLGGNEQVQSMAEGLDYVWDWALDGRWLLGGGRSPAGLSELRLVGADPSHPGNRLRTLATAREGYLRLARLSPNQRWVAFVVAKSGSSAVHMVDVESGASRPITDGSSFDDHPRWSPDGGTLYFLSNRTGFFNLWGHRLHPATGEPVGAPFQVTSFARSSQALPSRLRQLGVSASDDRLIVPVSEMSSSIWVLDGFDHR
jgi:Tol biopolymer transport system component/DNA-binding winged helix-turn-helix (wHTH) protein